MACQLRSGHSTTTRNEAGSVSKVSVSVTTLTPRDTHRCSRSIQILHVKRSLGLLCQFSNRFPTSTRQAKLHNQSAHCMKRMLLGFKSLKMLPPYQHHAQQSGHQHQTCINSGLQNRHQHRIYDVPSSLIS